MVALDAHTQEALDEMAWAIDASQGEFKLLFARCNYLRLRRSLMAELKQRCTTELTTVALKPTDQTLYTTLREALGDVTPGAVMVTGLEKLNNLDAVLSATNRVREEFRRSCPYPLVLWITDEVQRRLSVHANDFESWGISTLFKLAPGVLRQALDQAETRLFEQLLTPDSPLPFNQLLERLSLGFFKRNEMDLALQDFTAQGQTFTPSFEANLAFAKGLNLPAEPQNALGQFQQSLAFWQQSDAVDAPLKAGLVLYYLGRYQSSDKPDYRHIRDEATARRYLEQSVHQFEQAQRPDLAAKAMLQLGHVLETLEDWDTLENLSQRFLPLQQRYGTPAAQAQTYSFLAAAALQKKQSETAVRYATEALSLVDETRWVRGHYLTQLAVAAEQQSDLAAALDHLKVAQTIDSPPAQKIETLRALHRVYSQQKDYLAAFKVKQQRRSVEQQYGLRAFVGAGRLEARRTVQEDNPTTQLRETETVVPEITASGRQKDLNTLLERLTKNENKLIVLHGLSGVGKSSLVNGGLLPSLRQKTVRGQQLVPVLVRQYVDWAIALGQAIAEAQDQTKNTEQTLQTSDEILAWLRESENRMQRPVLIFDQFEEFFFANTDPLERRRFFEFLGDCLNILPVKVMLSLREDYIHYLLECNRLQGMNIIGQDILSKQVLCPIGNFTAADTESIVQSMTEYRPYAPEPELVEVFVDDLAGDLDEVRPIELQLVGAQLESDQITTLAQYQALGGGPKTELVRRYLNRVVQDCGPENAALAELVLFLLTDERGTRPLKTRPELERELEALEALPVKPEPLNLVLGILSGAGMVVDLPDKPDHRYQLVHDYLAEFIRQQKAPQLEKLAAELEAERQQRLAAEAEKDVLAEANQKAKRRILISTLLLAASLVAAVVAVPAALIASNDLRSAKAETSQIEKKAAEAEEAAEAANKQVFVAEARLAEADIKVVEADDALATAKEELEQITSQSEQELRQAQENIAQAEVQAYQARQEQARAAQAAAAAQEQQQQAQIALALAEQEKQRAEDDIVFAREITDLERESTSIFRRLQTYSSVTKERQGQIEVLLSAVQTGKALRAMVTPDQSLAAYPAFGPVYTLQQVLQSVREKNRFEHERAVSSVSFSPDGQQVLTGS
ncbi:MAG: hypothetical protein AAF728_09095, partial [Cyanobacteria bacterium P01_D01_bin.128]